ncbi:MAG: AAA family ATPase [Thermoplasmata archaeon]|nr:AAA family ATPase [Thermoplasmata archaeon]
MKTTRIKTFIKGLDKEMSGGVPEGSVVLIAGKPGTMKSSLAFNILYHNANIDDVSGVYVTLEQSRESLLSNMDGLGMKLGGLEKEISVLDLGMIRKKLTQLTNQTWMEVFKMYLQNLKKNMDIKVVVIDSLPVLEVMAKFQNPREELFHFFEWLRDMDVTAFLITEMQQGSDQFCKYDEDFLSDGIIHLDLKRENNMVNLFLGVVKMRQTGHKRGYSPLIFDKDGFEIVSD